MNKPSRILIGVFLFGFSLISLQGEPGGAPQDRKTKIAFHSSRDGNPEIYVMNPDGSRQINLTNIPAKDTNPSWSPDGKKIAFRSVRNKNWDIYVMNADGSELKRLTDNPAQDDCPAWSPCLR